MSAWGDGWEGVDPVRRIMLNAGRLSSTGVDTFLKFIDTVQAETDKGYIMSRDGSIVSASILFTVATLTTPGNVRLRVLVNGGGGLNTNYIDITETGLYKASIVQESGISTFVIEDVITLKLDFLTFEGTIEKIIALGEIEFDT